MCEFFTRLIEIMLDSEPNLVNLRSIAKLYEQKYDVEFNAEYRIIQDKVLKRSRSTIYIDSSGYLHLNKEDVDVKRIMTERLVQASLDADIDSDSFESPTSSSSDRYMGNPEALFNRSYHGRTRADKEDLSDLAGAKLHEELVRFQSYHPYTCGGQRL
ncbi:unnamed protein product [Cylicostephanus goldi]|uniref:Uncharacterized protein n=1 Tax=Cylicostephanus goldi TaxID=71465 RepID=A0A3P7NDP6_CYLGO|nr:unnamed protein product [Cylicostephanus goldi]